MATLRLLGGLSLCNATGAEIHAITAQSKRIALLACLSLANRTRMRRDTLLALLWPELDAEHARHALRQGLYALRRELSPAALPGAGDDEVSLDPAVIECDVIRFEAALDAGDPARALALYRGDLLPGFYLSGCADFEQWLESARHRLRQQAVEAAIALAHAAAAAREHADAVRWSRRATELAPFDEPLLRAHLEALEAAGDGAGALLAYEAFATRTRRELGIDPAPETEAVVTRIRTRGAPRRRRRRSLAVAERSLLPPTPESRTRKRVRFAFLVVLAPILLGLFVAAFESWGSRDERLHSGLLAIPPFRVLAPTADSLVLAEGVPELLWVALQDARDPRVIDPRLAAQRWRAVLGRDGSPGPGLAREVARALGAAHVLDGSIFPRGDRVVITAGLTNVADGQARNPVTVEGPAADLVALVQQLATKTLGGLSGEDPLHLSAFTSTSYAAVQAYLTGRIEARRGRYQEAFALLNDALEIDSTFALAALALVDVSGWAGRGDGTLGMYEQWAYRHRDRLGPADTAYLRAWIGGDAYTGRGSSSDLFQATARAETAHPDRIELVHLLGDRYYHNGEFLQQPDALRRARELFHRAIVLDTGFAPARAHLLELAVIEDDRAEVRRQRSILLRHEADGSRTPYLLWLAAHSLGERAEQRRMRAAIDTMNLPALDRLVRTAVEIGIGIDDARLAAHSMRARAGTEAERLNAAVTAGILFSNLGLAEEALRADPMPVVSAAALPADLGRILQSAMFSDVVPPQTEAAVKELARRASVAGGHDVLYFLHSWRLWHRDSVGARAALTQLRAQPPVVVNATSTILSDHAVRIAILEALLEHLSLPPTAAAPRPALAALHALVLAGTGRRESVIGNIILARIYTELDQPRHALDAARRRQRATGASIFYLAPLLRAEARLAASLGDRAGARRAYAHFLALRDNPDPRLRPQADSMRAEYRRLR